MALLATKGKAPGVYIQEITIPGPIAAAATSITAFVGPAQFGPLLKPTELTNINQFENLFGSYIEDPYRVFVTHAVHGFFAEGGADCYFVRVGKGKAARLNLFDRSGKRRVTLVVTALKEGAPPIVPEIKVSVANANIVSTAKAARASATIDTGGAPANGRTARTANAGDANNFRPGDVVLLKKGANEERNTIASITKDTAANTTTFTMVANLTNDYGAPGGTIRIADLTPGQTRFGVDLPAGLEPGTYIVISDGTNEEAAVVRVVDQINSLVTVTKPLTNRYKMATGDPDVTVKSQEFTLTTKVVGSPDEVFPNLSLDPRHSRYFARIVSSARVSLELADPPTVTPPEKNLPVALGDTALTNGANENLDALTPADYQAGIDALKKIDEIRILCVPDAVTTLPVTRFQIPDTQAIQAAMVAHCEKMQDRFAVLDSSQFDPKDISFSNIVQQRQNLNSDNGFAALYFPWIGIANPFGSGKVFVPPSGHIAGIYANNDNLFGVFKAPANEQVTTALSVEVLLTDDEQGPLNDLGINVIRTFPFQGIKIWGARTITSPDAVPWRFVNVRRLLLFIEKSIQNGTRFAVFEPNNIKLWGQLKRMVTDFLMDQWKAGALFGDIPDKAFRVRVDEVLNPPELRAQGILVVEVTVVPTTPAEFIIFQVIQDITGSTLREA